ncbi:uncharacterized protein EDB93DRAFT_1338661 [Suillus bovinus]|uniref:uncharacterized protein n=1 Tax=Suillus bovinus TaxID=48563 RepID=UPI001B867711|nr:uncharacterized protein EDB93DRAFT_1338661 [Suillus bovinus]KAG2141160.1 hypothetical protein EDB93DRAFT_1338661 [Suillus bovinus]
MSEDHRPGPPPETCNATVGESSSQPRSRVKQAIQKFAKGFIKKLSKWFKRSRNPTSAVQNTDLQGASSNQNIEDMSHPHLSADNNHPASSENPSGCVNQGTSGEPTSKGADKLSSIEEIPGSKLVGDELQHAHQAVEHMDTVGGHAKSVASVPNKAQAGLAAMDNFQTTYLQPLKIFDTVIGTLSNVHPYAKMALGILSAAAKIILTQAERDESVDRLLQKIDEVYNFITQDENLSKVESMHDVIGKIAQQTLECARFIREYSETKNFCESSEHRIRTLILRLL